ncbi:MAG: regulatory protein RecX [Oscillospiraceae bacterium]|nr:regulatory protein RecX [Oscillospiraceae bacterium]
MDRTVVRVVPSAKRKDRFYVDLDSGESLTVTTAQVADFGLRPGRTFDEAEFALLTDSASLTAAKGKALEALARRPLSRREVTDRLDRKGVREDIVEETADWLERLGYVNDEEYAGQIVRHYASKGYGAGRVREELARRGVAREYWEDALRQMPDTADAVDRFLRLKLRGEPDRKEKKRVADALLRRGFSWEEIRSAMERWEMERWENGSE